MLVFALGYTIAIYTLHALNLKQKIYRKNLPFFLLLLHRPSSLTASLYTICMCLCVFEFRKALTSSGFNFVLYVFLLLTYRKPHLFLPFHYSFADFSKVITHSHTNTSAARCTNSISLLDFVCRFLSVTNFLLMSPFFPSCFVFLVRHRQDKKERNEREKYVIFVDGKI